MTEITPPVRGHGRFLPWLLTLADFILLNVILLTVMFVILHTDDWTGRRRFILLISNVAMIPVATYFTKVHAVRTTHIQRLLSAVIRGVFAQWILFMALMEIFHPVKARLDFYLVLLGFNIVLFPLMWIAANRVLKAYRRRGRNIRQAIIVGTSQAALRLYRNINSDPGYGVRVIGFVADAPTPETASKYLGELSSLQSLIKRHNIEYIYCAGPGVSEDKIKHIIKTAEENLCQFFYIPPFSHHVKRDFMLVSVNNSIPALTFQKSRIHSIQNRFIKRTFDIAFSTAVLAFTPIVLPIIAVAIKISSPGPVFFCQERTGYHGKSFKCFKFRTMRVNADADSRQASKDDNRKTRLGNFLRHTSIDELPQFWNVFRGDMSVVGPRPHMLAHTDQYSSLISQYMVRHQVKPGITGWAQITGSRGATEELWMMEQRVDKDVWYIEHWTFMLDLKIIVKTVTNAVKGESQAY